MRVSRGLFITRGYPFIIFIFYSLWILFMDIYGSKFFYIPAIFMILSAKSRLLFWKDRLVIPSYDQLKTIFYEFHVSKIGGMQELLKLLLGYLLNFMGQICVMKFAGFSGDCSICQQPKSDYVLPALLILTYS